MTFHIITFLQVFHKKFDKIRKHMIHNEATGETTEHFTDAPPAIVIEESKNDPANADLPKSPKVQRPRLSAGEAHPQLLAHLQSPNKAGMVGMSPGLGTQSLGSLHPGAFLNNNGLTAALSRSPDVGIALESTNREGGIKKEQLHATTMSHLKDKLMRKYDSVENLQKIGQNLGQCLENGSSSSSVESNHNPSSVESLPFNMTSGYQEYMPPNPQGQVPVGGMFAPCPSAMHPAFIGTAYSSMHSMSAIPGYNQHLAGMQQLAQFYGQGPQVR